MKEQESKCLTCKKTVCECRWLSELVEADDWKATIKMVNQDGQEIERIIVIDCPRYESTKR